MEKKKLLVVVDYQNDFVVGSLGFEEAKGLDKGIANKVQGYLDNGDMVLFTFDTHDDYYKYTQEGKLLPVEHCISGTDGHMVYGDTGKLLDKELRALNKNVVTICKSSFGSDTLFRLLRKCWHSDGYEEILNTDIHEIELVGVVTNMCVIANAIICKTALPEVPIRINKGLCASFDKELHNKALDVMGSMQMEII